MKLQFALAASIACAVGACSGMGGPPATGTTGFGNDPAPTHGPEPTVGGPEPGISGLDPGPGGGHGPGNTVPELCAYDCMRIEMICPGSTGTNCAADCAGDLGNFPPACADLAIQFLQCFATEPLACVNGDISSPTCEVIAQYISACLNQNTTPPTGGGTPVPQGGTAAGAP